MTAENYNKDGKVIKRTDFQVGVLNRILSYDDINVRKILFSFKCQDALEHLVTKITAYNNINYEGFKVSNQERALKELFQNFSQCTSFEAYKKNVPQGLWKD